MKDELTFTAKIVSKKVKLSVETTDQRRVRVGNILSAVLPVKSVSKYSSAQMHPFIHYHQVTSLDRLLIHRWCQTRRL